MRILARRPRDTVAVALISLAVITAGCGGSSAGSVDPSPTAGESSAAASAEPSAATTATASPALSVGDGEPWIAYQWVASLGDGIFLVRPDGTGQHQLVPDMTGSEIHPDWSPDGARIAFVRQTPEGPTELWVVDADGTDAERLYACDVPCSEIHYPDWSPDGASIFVSQSGDVRAGEVVPRSFSILRVDVADGAITTMYERDDGVEAWQARVSPDGTTLAYVAGSEELGAAIFTSSVDGGPETRLTEWEMLAAHPDWTLDGRIVFHTYDLAIFPSIDEPANLFIMDADGGNVEQLTRFEDPGHRVAQSRVAPDGSGVTLTLVEGSGSGTRRLAFLVFGDTQPSWLPADPIDGTHPHLRPAS